MTHIHDVYDDDPHFEIDPESRSINYTGDDNLLLIQGDHNSERYTFSIPREVDGHDMTLCNVVQIHYINIGGGTERNSDIYKVDDLVVDTDDDDILTFSWLVSQNATRLVGSLNFMVRFACTTGNKVEYVWHTNTFSGINIASSIDNAGLVVEQNSDILESWYTELIMAGTSGVNIVVEARDEALAEIDAAEKTALQNTEYIANAVKEVKVHEESAEQSAADAQKSAEEAREFAESIDLNSNDLEIHNSIQLGRNPEVHVGNKVIIAGENVGALSDNSQSFGLDTIAGCMGYYWRSIDFTNKKIYLCAEQTTPDDSTTDYTDTTFETPGYSVGDVIAIVNNNKFFPKAKITAIEHNVITYDDEYDPENTGLGFTAIIPVDSETYDIDDYSIFVPEKPEIGLVSIKRSAFVAGFKSKVIANAGASVGTDNLVYGDHGFTYNYGNKAAWAASAGGYGNESNGFYSDTVGRNNINNAECGRMAGRLNTSTKRSYGADIGGYNNHVDAEWVHVGGCGNTVNHNIQGSNGSDVGGEGNTLNGAKNVHMHGKGNKVLGSEYTNKWGGAQSDIGGLNNTIDGREVSAVNIHIHGENNNAYHRNVDIGGNGNYSTADNQMIRGTYSDSDPDAYLIIGCGTSKTNRKNAFAVHKDGAVLVGSKDQKTNWTGYNYTEGTILCEKPKFGVSDPDGNTAFGVFDNGQVWLGNTVIVNYDAAIECLAINDSGAETDVYYSINRNGIYAQGDITGHIHNTSRLASYAKWDTSSQLPIFPDLLSGWYYFSLYVDMWNTEVSLGSHYFGSSILYSTMIPIDNGTGRITLKYDGSAIELIVEQMLDGETSWSIVHAATDDEIGTIYDDHRMYLSYARV